jgi:predicted ABC-type ATPase
VKVKPIAVFVGGPNGAGKSTITPGVAVGPIIDPDAIAKRINSGNPQADALLAARETLKTLKDHNARGASFTYETTLSSNNALTQMRDARAAGFHVELYFVGLDEAFTSQIRVGERVEKGGHAIPEEDIYRRFERTFDNLRDAAPLADRVTLIDNTQKTNAIVLEIVNGHILHRSAAPSHRVETAAAELVTQTLARDRPPLLAETATQRGIPAPSRPMAEAMLLDKTTCVRTIATTPALRDELRHFQALAKHALAPATHRLALTPGYQELADALHIAPLEAEALARTLFKATTVKAAVDLIPEPPARGLDIIR